MTQRRTAPADWLRPELESLVAYEVPDPEGLIKLNAMENPYRWPPALVGDWLKALEGVSLNRYPDPRAMRVKEALREQLSIPPEMAIVLGNGSDELIQLVSLCLRAGSAVLAPRPSFVMYRLCALAAGHRYHAVALEPGDFRIRPEAMLEAIARERPAVCFLAFPNNPTGNLFDEGVVEHIIEATPGLVVVDEAYAPFAGSSYLDRLGEFSNLLVMRTLSKLGLAGLRLGFLVGPARWLDELEKLRLPYNVNVLTQASTEFALRHFDVIEEQTARIREDRERLYRALQAIPDVTPYPSAANFILIRVRADAGLVAERLRSGGVLVKNLHGSDPLLEGCLRVTVGTPAENAAFLDALSGALRPLSG